MPSSNKSLKILLLVCLIIVCATTLNYIEKESSSRSGTDSASIIPSSQDDQSKVATDLDPSFYVKESPTKDKPVTVKVTPSDGISALAYIAANLNTDVVYVGRNVKQVLPVASMSKLVTAFAATDMLPATTTITITKEETEVPGDGSGIYEGETYLLSELLYPLLLDSSNIAAEALASTTNRKNFLELMSSYAWEIGMSTAYFADPSGVNPHNAASANDLFALAKYLYKFRPDILALTRTVSTSVATTTEHGSHNFISIHPFVRDPDFVGGKTGRTPEAGDTMLTIMKIGDEPIAIVVLGSRYDGRAVDTRKIIEMVKTKM